MKPKLLLTVFFLGGPLWILGGLFFSQQQADHLNQQKQIEINQLNRRPVLAATSQSSPTIGYTIQAGDARQQILTNYLQSFNAPLATASADLVAAADRYQLDFRLLAAIARQESNGCKYIPPDTHNCWGWGIHKRGTLGFTSLTDGIYTVSQGIREKYINDGLVTPEQIMSRYTPSSPGTWSAAVTQFMQEME
jgi:hypothetical protein